MLYLPHIWIKHMRKILLLLVCFLLSLLGMGQSVRIGDILCTDGTTVSAADFPSSGRTALGVVFYVDDNDIHGWAVALHNQSSSIKWSSSNYYGYDIPNLVNYENARTAMYNLDGSQNTDIIRNTSSATNFPAAWAVDYDDGWFLPSAAQLRYMFSYYPEINASLQVVGGSQFPLDGNYYWWSSTECSGYHAYDMNSGGSIGDYVKDNHSNYPPNGIAVRQIIDFSIPNPEPATYHIGDIITNDDGSQGILFYVSPDQTEGWMVALEDASTAISWGIGDVPELDNQTCVSPFGMLLNETDGYANTGIIRDHQSGMNTAANVVDYGHEWYLPSAGQLSKLFGALPFIENKLQAYGRIMEQDEYWSSSEANADEAFAVSFKPSGNVRAGGFVRSNKNRNYHVRAVRNLVQHPLPIVGTISTPEPICENETLTLQAPETQSTTSEGWQLSPTSDFDNPIPYEDEPLNYSYNGWFLRYFATNEYGTVISNTVSIVVWPSHETSFNSMACTHFVWNGIDYDESGDYEQHLTSIHGCDSIVTMHLTIADIAMHEWSHQTCEDSFAWNETTYTATGDYEQTFSTIEGCDSIVTLHLNMFDAYDITTDSTVCGSFVWNGSEYTESGHYEQLLVSHGGCDSLVRMNLTILPFPDTVPEIVGVQEVYVSTDIVLGQYSYSTDSVDFATYYEWLVDGLDWVLDATGTHCTLLITHPGIATLKVRAWNYCGYTEQEIVIHAGFFGIDDKLSIPVKIYPNPASDKVFIEAKDIVHVKFFDLHGQCIINEEGNDDIMEIFLNDLVSNVYIIEILTEQGRVIRKLNVIR